MDLPSDGWRYIIEKRDVPTVPASISSFIFYVRSLNVNQQFGKLRAEFFESLTFNYFRPAKKKEKIVLGFCSQRGSEGDDEHGVGEVEGKVRVMMRAKELPRVMRRLITGWLATLGLTDHQEMCGHHSYTDVHIGSWYFPFLFLCWWSFIFGICI